MQKLGHQVATWGDITYVQSNQQLTSHIKSSSIHQASLVSAFFQQARAVIQPMESVDVIESWEVVLPSLFM